jgi:hypothetical protein
MAAYRIKEPNKQLTVKRCEKLEFLINPTQDRLLRD